MDHSAAGAGPAPGRRPSSPSPGSLMCAKGQAAPSGQRPNVKITPFHSSPIASGDGALRSKRPAAASGKLLASPGSLFRDTPGRLTAPPVRERLAVPAAPAPASAAGTSVEHPTSSGSALAPAGAKTQPSPLEVKVNLYADEHLRSVKQFSVKF